MTDQNIGKAAYSKFLTEGPKALTTSELEAAELYAYFIARMQQQMHNQVIQQAFSEHAQRNADKVAKMGTILAAVSVFTGLVQIVVSLK